MEERFATTVTVVFDQEAVEQRTREYAQAIQATFEEEIATSAQVEVVVGEVVIVVGTASPPASPPAGPSDRRLSETATECGEQYTPVTATITLQLAVPLDEADAMIAALPDSTFNTGGDTVPVCEQTRQETETATVDAPPPPSRPPPPPGPSPSPTSAVDEGAITVLGIVAGAIALCLLCCLLLFAFGGRRRRDEEKGERVPTDDVDALEVPGTAATAAMQRMRRLGAQDVRSVRFGA